MSKILMITATSNNNGNERLYIVFDNQMVLDFRLFEDYKKDIRLEEVYIAPIDKLDISLSLEKGLLGAEVNLGFFFNNIGTFSILDGEHKTLDFVFGIANNIADRKFSQALGF